MNDKATGTSEQVLDYYSRNWEKIAHCYALDDNGMPVDPAWYRRRLYQQFLDEKKPASLIDIGCGGGWTVKDALDRGIEARGIEPVRELKEFGCNLLSENGFDPGRITQEDLRVLEDMQTESHECISLLSVLPHVKADRWDHYHEQIARTLKPGGRLFAAYRNELFDLFTFNSITMDFYLGSLWEGDAMEGLRNKETWNHLRGLIANPDIPGSNHTLATDKSFGKLDRVKSNPMTIGEYFKPLGLTLERVRYFHFHGVPPLMADKVENIRNINHELELSLSDDWRGNFMAAIFLVEVVKA